MSNSLRCRRLALLVGAALRSLTYAPPPKAHHELYCQPQSGQRSLFYPKFKCSRASELETRGKRVPRKFETRERITHQLGPDSRDFILRKS